MLFTHCADWHSSWVHSIWDDRNESIVLVDIFGCSLEIYPKGPAEVFRVGALRVRPS